MNGARGIGLRGPPVVRDIETGTILKTFEGPFVSVSLSPDKTHLAIMYPDGAPQTINLSSGTRTTHSPRSQPLHTLFVSESTEEGHRLVVLSPSGERLSETPGFARHLRPDDSAPYPGPAGELLFNLGQTLVSVSGDGRTVTDILALSGSEELVWASFLASAEIAMEIDGDLEITNVSGERRAIASERCFGLGTLDPAAMLAALRCDEGFEIYDLASGELLSSGPSEVIAFVGEGSSVVYVAEDDDGTYAMHRPVKNDESTGTRLGKLYVRYPPHSTEVLSVAP